jgi:hypothetical protein
MAARSQIEGPLRDWAFGGRAPASWPWGDTDRRTTDASMTTAEGGRSWQESLAGRRGAVLTVGRCRRRQARCQG